MTAPKKILKVIGVDPETAESIDEVMRELNDLWVGGGEVETPELRGLVVYAMLEGDETRAWSTAGLSTREVIGALFQLALDKHIAMVVGE